MPLLRPPLFLCASPFLPRSSTIHFHVQHHHTSRRRNRAPHRKVYTPCSSATLVDPYTLLKDIETNPYLRVLDLRGRVVKPTGRVDAGFQPFEYIADDEAYNTNHVPTATFLDWRTIDVAKPDMLCDTLSNHGVTRETPVVVYDWGDMLFATRAWFTLKSLDVHHVAVLNGGWNAWESADVPVDDDSPCPLTIHADMECNIPEGSIPKATISLDDMRALVESSEPFVLVDARSEKQFIGVERRAKRAGRIPGSLNLPYRKLLEEDSVGLRSDDELRQILGDAGLLGRDVVAYCNGGVSSTLVLFSLVRCGSRFERLRNYCGSIGEWSNLQDTPIETG